MNLKTNDMILGKDYMSGKSGEVDLEGNDSDLLTISMNLLINDMILVINYFFY